MRGISGMKKVLAGGETPIINQADDFGWSIKNVGSKTSMAGGWENDFREIITRTMYQVGSSKDPDGSARYRIPVRLGYRWRNRTIDEAAQILARHKQNGDPLMIKAVTRTNSKETIYGMVEMTLKTWPTPFDEVSTVRESVSGHWFLVETDPSLTPIACYGELSSRNLCLDAGGVYDPGATVKCAISL
jgi:hypothetical protein